ncbi:hypothetical protein [Actinomadura montaniterrae]|uniref:Uncharacterized protein n=1 Tax=Actinomadura montaniterrae TaxID=1803903 RepID=A0A6L3W5W8_9ACTN|nr:hypothetical protein [Actinomadura montaniterrae]KAB2384745.1 hypothetical protein F9B16_09870 [Actinomadura montaniterrae]
MPTPGPLGIALDLDEGDLISDAVLIAKIHKADGAVIVASKASDGTDWVTRRGLIAAAGDVESGGYQEREID